MLPLEALDGLGFADTADHEAVSLERSMDGDSSDLHTSVSENRLDPHHAPSGVPSAQLEDPVDEDPVYAVDVAS